jgi:hypothetical protein
MRVDDEEHKKNRRRPPDQRTTTFRPGDRFDGGQVRDSSAFTTTEPNANCRR